jgi:hypothetical protein
MRCLLNKHPLPAGVAIFSLVFICFAIASIYKYALLRQAHQKKSARFRTNYKILLTQIYHNDKFKVSIFSYLQFDPRNVGAHTQSGQSG